MKKEDIVGFHVGLMCGSMETMRGSRNPKVALIATRGWPEIRDLAFRRFREAWSVMSAEERKAWLDEVEKHVGPMAFGVVGLLDIEDEKPTEN
jgi:hypothetical protein